MALGAIEKLPHSLEERVLQQLFPDSKIKGKIVTLAMVIQDEMHPGNGFVLLDLKDTYVYIATRPFCRKYFLVIIESGLEVLASKENVATRLPNPSPPPICPCLSVAGVLWDVLSSYTLDFSTLSESDEKKLKSRK